EIETGPARGNCCSISGINCDSPEAGDCLLRSSNAERLSPVVIDAGKTSPTLPLALSSTNCGAALADSGSWPKTVLPSSAKLVCSVQPEPVAMLRSISNCWLVVENVAVTVGVVTPTRSTVQAPLTCSVSFLSSGVTAAPSPPKTIASTPNQCWKSGTIPAPASPRFELLRGMVW